MKIEKLLSVKQTGGFDLDSQPEWEVTIQADGKAFKIELKQWNKPELHHIEAEAKTHWFWSFAAKAVVVEEIAP